MAYNHGKEECKWRIWKDTEEKVLRKCGMDESTIEQIRAYDREVFNSDSREQAYFFCSNYRKATENCTAHYIREKVIYQLVLESMRRVLYYVQAYENDFVKR